MYSLTDYCRSVTIVTKNQNNLFTRKIDQFHPKTGQFRHFFESLSGYSSIFILVLWYYGRLNMCVEKVRCDFRVRIATCITGTMNIDNSCHN